MWQIDYHAAERDFRRDRILVCGMGVDGLPLVRWRMALRFGRRRSVLGRWRGNFGGELVRFQVSRAERLGGFLTWRPALPVTQWAATKS